MPKKLSQSLTRRLSEKRNRNEGKLGLGLFFAFLRRIVALFDEKKRKMAQIQLFCNRFSILGQAPSNDSESYCGIENNKICLTPVTMDDKSLYNRIYTNADLLKFISVPLSLQSSTKSFETTLKRMSQKPMSLVLFAIRRQKNQQKIGVIGLKWNQSSKKCAEIGIVILQEYQGNGFGHQAKSLLIEYAFKNCAINKIVAVCDIKNHIANQANKKLGFVMDEPKIQSQQTKIRWIKYK